MPDSLDRSDRFFTNTERIMLDSQVPALSADTRKFFATTSTQIQQTSTQIQQIRSEMDGMIGTEGELMKFSEEARAAIKAADPRRDVE